ncbi:uncharacterized protein LOC8073043 isoform X3 [Sorghum bicolor]|uniref:uncharacterized protein LOC8073043 isoform X3 n=1 Tax=Sorghum bicolor TaxID=4558 RepID=UPI000B42440C|nr:uncharacterized protein LOC8073043 isoform X3 [Sorghum bicolor]|eukprot:XP_021304555.1 uncharacterized protein LOC8073043 isoform X3 [Sorghum bicolor]
MAPGKSMVGGKNTPSRPTSVLPDDAASLEMPEHEDMDLSSLRARNIMRNNQFATQLGVRRLAEYIQISAKKRVATKSIGKKSKGKHVGSSMSPSGDCVKGGAGRTSKRVLAPEIPEETMRCTRLRAARQVSTTSEPDLSANQNQGDTSNTEQGNLTLSTEVESMGLNTTEQGTCTGTIQVRPRGETMGKEIDSISHGLGCPIPIIIKKGKRRPEAPMQAAKLASESGTIMRKNIKIYPNWTKYYKNNGEQLENLKGKLKIKFDINTDSSPVKAACEDILKGGVRQMRYRLKKKYFDGVPANQVRTTSPLKHMSDEEWRQLVDMWSSPEHKDKCAKNQLNREKVKYQQRTGSRSYIAQAYVVKQEKYKDSEPTAINLFEEFHCSKTKGFSEPVKKAIDDMHAQEALTSPPVEDGQQAKTSIEAISKVLPKSNTFLRNVGIQQPAAKTPNVVKDLQTELDAKKLESARLQQELERLKAQAQESDAKVDKQAEEIASLRKMAAENQSLLRQMIAFGQSQIAPP